MQESRYFGDIAFKDAQSIRIRDHDGGDVFVDECRQSLQIDCSPPIRWNGLDYITGNGSACWIGSVSGIRNENPLSWVPSRLVISANHQDPCQLSVRARRRLQSDGIHAADLSETVLEGLLHFQCALNLIGGRVWMG